MRKHGEMSSTTDNMPTSTEEPTSSESLFQVVEKRRSVRRYKQYSIPPQDLSSMLNAARLAPSVENTQPWRFIVVRNQEMKEILAEAAIGQKFISNANAV
ncbi:MAG: nitroreductase family protein, partial [Candidatus Thorarchaeota archaeon]